MLRSTAAPAWGSSREGREGREGCGHCPAPRRNRGARRALLWDAEGSGQRSRRAGSGTAHTAPTPSTPPRARLQHPGAKGNRQQKLPAYGISALPAPGLNPAARTPLPAGGSGRSRPGHGARSTLLCQRCPCPSSLPAQTAPGLCGPATLRSHGGLPVPGGPPAYRQPLPLHSHPARGHGTAGRRHCRCVPAVPDRKSVV